jgi:NitT/TauT family transport system substrate-binding protein
MKKALAALALVAIVTTGCASSAKKAAGKSTELRLGVFPNLTHAPGLVGISKGIIQKDLGSNTKLKVVPFNSGSDASNALLAGSIDATYIGPGPTVSLFIKSGKVAVVSGATEGGAALVVRTGVSISSPADFAGKKIADPGTGNTQDVALRTWLHQNGLKAKDEGGNVTIVPLEKNSDSVQLMSAKQIDAAWLPEPYPSLLVSQNLATRYLDEKTLWPAGKFLTTNLLVTTGYLSAHPDVVKNLVKGNVDSIRYIQQNSTQAATIANTELATLGGKGLDANVLQPAWSEMTFSWDPLPSALLANAQHSQALGYIDSVPSNLMSIYKLQDLNAVLTSIGQPAMKISG